MITVYLATLEHEHGSYSQKAFWNHDAAFDWADCMQEPGDGLKIERKQFTDADVALEYYEAF